MNSAFLDGNFNISLAARQDGQEKIEALTVENILVAEPDEIIRMKARLQFANKTIFDLI